MLSIGVGRIGNVLLVLLRTDNFVAILVKHHLHLWFSSQTVNSKRVGIGRSLEISATVVVDGIVETLWLVELGTVVLKLLVTEY